MRVKIILLGLAALVVSFAASLYAMNTFWPPVVQKPVLAALPPLPPVSRNSEIRTPIAAEASVAGFDDVALAAYVDPPLTTIAQRTEEMGRWAVARLVGEDGLGPSSVRLPVDLQIRDSTGPAPT